MEKTTLLLLLAAVSISILTWTDLSFGVQADSSVAVRISVENDTPVIGDAVNLRVVVYTDSGDTMTIHTWGEPFLIYVESDEGDLLTVPHRPGWSPTGDFGETYTIDRSRPREFVLGIAQYETVYNDIEHNDTAMYLWRCYASWVGEHTTKTRREVTPGSYLIYLKYTCRVSLGGQAQPVELESNRINIEFQKQELTGDLSVHSNVISCDTIYVQVKNHSERTIAFQRPFNSKGLSIQRYEDNSWSTLEIAWEERAPEREVIMPVGTAYEVKWNGELRDSKRGYPNFTKAPQGLYRFVLRYRVEDEYREVFSEAFEL